MVNTRAQRIKLAEKKRNTNAVIVLYEIEKHDNVSLILRTVEAFGFKNVYIVPHPITKSRIKSSVAKHADKWLKIEYLAAPELINRLIQKRYKLVATVLNPDSQKLSNFTFPKKTALLLGRETSGLPKELIDRADYKVYIPMNGLTQSLNVSAAAAIFLYKLAKK